MSFVSLLAKSECCICLAEHLATDERTHDIQLLGVLRCGHIFHVDCVMKHLSYHRFCPLCRATVPDIGTIVTPLKPPAKVNPSKAVQYEQTLDVALRDVRGKEKALTARVSHLVSSRESLAKDNERLTVELATHEARLLELKSGTQARRRALLDAAEDARRDADDVAAEHQRLLKELAELEERLHAPRKRPRGTTGQVESHR